MTPAAPGGGADAGKQLRVSLLQTAPQLGCVERNLAKLHAELDQLTDTDVAVAPELALHGYFLGALDEVDALAADDQRLAGLGQHGPAVIAGFVEHRRSDQYNSAAVIDRDRVTVQRKLFLPTYRGWEERKHFRPGGRLQSFDLRGARAAVLICNDIWQPPLPWLAVHSGAEVLFVIANSVRSHSVVQVERAWELLLAHSAVVLQSYVVFVNRSGTECGQEFWGGSRVLGPDGAEIARLGTEPGRTEATLDLTELRALRRRWPLLREARLDVISRALETLMQEED
ncbi:nitrilase-related carbon-nitrogen hydrolase [Geodermatophilus sp. DF01_2]|uniref:nitrilase-related carbon-nitrogen hydrolase n=1 Tax=Geodermatophilus sp. DF01-2 TaxID=2559610 RepID=UPI001431B59C|nr:nitrilase-related carbon-nitrogen hydrolase [Geodermatophilus sp. DF01_2]